MTKENELVVRLIHGRLAHVGWGVGMTGLETAEHLAEGLADAGLLSTPAMRQAAEAILGIQDDSNWLQTSDAPYTDEWKRIRAAKRALLFEEAERAPKPRWRAVYAGTGGWSVETSSQCMGIPLPKEHAEAVVALLNGLERGK